MSLKRCRPHRSEPGGFDVVPQDSTYRSKETTGFYIILAYRHRIVDRIMAEYTDSVPLELIPGQVESSPKGVGLAQALQSFFADADHIGGSLYLESLATLILGHVIRHRSTLSGQIKRVPDCLTPKQLKAIVEYIQFHLHSDLRLYQLANHVSVSPYYLAHGFKAATGVSPHQYVLHCRLEQAQRLLKGSRLSIAEIAYEVGFGNQSHMTTVFRRKLRTTPNLYRQQAENC